jgi:DNA-binding beta-propeller fold protein YncE
MVRKSYLFSLLAMSCIALMSCAPAKVPEAVILYPDLPEQPRIAYIATYWGEDNFKERTLMDRLFGAEAGRSIDKPYGVAALGSKIYATMSGKKSPGIAVFDLEKRTFGTFGDVRGEKLGVPTGIAVAQDGTVFVADSSRKRVIKFDNSGRTIGSIGGEGEYQVPAGIAVNDGLGRVYIADSYGHCVKVFSYAGEKLFQFGVNGTGEGQFHYPTNVAIDRSNSNVAVVDTQNFRVQIFDKDGAYLKKFGEVGDTPGAFSRPKGIGIDSEGHLYVIDAGFSNIQIFDDKGQLLLHFGNMGIGSGEFQVPAGLYIDENDRIYVADSLNHRIMIFQYFSERWIKANPEEYAKLTGPEKAKAPGLPTPVLIPEKTKDPGPSSPSPAK